MFINNFAIDRFSYALNMKRNFLLFALCFLFLFASALDEAVFAEARFFSDIGVIGIEHVDDFEQHQGRVVYLLTTQDQSYELSFAAPAPQLAPDDLVRVEGDLTGAVLAVSKIEKLGGSGGALLAEQTKGAQKVGVFFLSFEDRPFAFPFDSAYQTVGEEVFREILAEVSSFYQEASYEKTQLSFEIAGSYTLGKSSQYPGCNLLNLGVKEAAQSDGADERAQYSRLIYLFPSYGSDSNSCTARGTVGKIQEYYAPGAPRFSIAYIPTSRFESQTISHELGHNFGLRHANFLNCNGWTIQTSAMGCASEEYGDVYDTMSDGLLMHFNAPHKEKLGWFDARNVLEVRSTGYYSLAPLEARTSGAQTLKILRAAGLSAEDQWYYVEYRYPQGYDNQPTFILYNKKPGLLFHILYNKAGGDTQLLDPSPQDTEFHSALTHREVYYDPAARFALALTDSGAESARVHVDFSPVLFVRGDANRDGVVSLSDSVFILNYFFKGGSPPRCMDAADANDDSRIDIADAVYINNFLFYGGAMPFQPFPEKGIDPTWDALNCAGYP